MIQEGGWEDILVADVAICVLAGAFEEWEGERGSHILANG